MPLDHYISQVHLRKFYAPDLGERFYAIRKSDLRTFTQNSKNVCRIEEGNSNQYLEEPRAIEEFLKEVEPRYNFAIQKIIEGEINPEIIFIISGFLGYIMTCSPTAMRMKSVMLEEMVKEEARILDKKGTFPDTPKAFKGKSLTELIDSGAIKVDIDKKYPQAIGVTTIIDRTYEVGNFHWEILVNEHADSPFFTSDFPVAPESTRFDSPITKTIPLTPTLAIRITPKIELQGQEPDIGFKNFTCKYKKIQKRQADTINKLIVRSAENTIFYSKNLEWIPRFVERNRNFRTTTKLKIFPAEKGKFFWYRHTIEPHQFT